MTSHPGPWERGGWLDLAYRVVTRVSFFGCALVIALLILWVVAGFAVLAYVVWETRPPSQVQFDSRRWKDPSEDDEVRWRMHKDLIRDYGLIGMTEDEVIDLLGYDCGCSYFREDYDMVYWMGPEQESLFQIDSIWLALKLGEDARVTEYCVLTD